LHFITPRSAHTIDTSLAPEAVGQAIRGAIHDPTVPGGIFAGWVTPERFEIRHVYASRNGQPVAVGTIEGLGMGAQLRFEIHPSRADQLGALFLVGVAACVPVVLCGLAIAKGPVEAVKGLTILFIAVFGLVAARRGYEIQVDALVADLRNAVSG
jgi:hypothetical protein